MKETKNTKRSKRQRPWMLNQVQHDKGEAVVERSTEKKGFDESNPYKRVSET